MTLSKFAKKVLPTTLFAGLCVVFALGFGSCQNPSSDDGTSYTVADIAGNWMNEDYERYELTDDGTGTYYASVMSSSTGTACTWTVSGTTVTVTLDGTDVSYTVSVMSYEGEDYLCLTDADGTEFYPVTEDEE